MPTEPRSLPSCMLRGTNPYTIHAQSILHCSRTAYLSGTSRGQCNRRSAPASVTSPTARSTAYTSVPVGRHPTPSPLLFLHQRGRRHFPGTKLPPSSGHVLSGVARWPWLDGVDHDADVILLAPERGGTVLTVVAVTPIRPRGMDVVHVSDGTSSLFSFEILLETLPLRRAIQ